MKEESLEIYFGVYGCLIYNKGVIIKKEGNIWKKMKLNIYFI